VSLLVRPEARPGEWCLGEHAHPHGSHVHHHVHGRDPWEHDGRPDAHGWHDPSTLPPGMADYDDTFGEEPASLRQPSGAMAKVNFPEGPFILTPFVKSRLSAVVEGGPPLPWLKVRTEGSQYDYWDLLCRALAHRVPFVLIEHDMSVNKAQVLSLLRCSRPVCGYSYSTYQGDVLTVLGALGALGCMAYKDKEMMAKLGKALREVGATTWSRLDGRAYGALCSLGYDDPHAHDGTVGHLHVYQR
jgi:hypothetical protein